MDLNLIWIIQIHVLKTKINLDSFDWIGFDLLIQTNTSNCCTNWKPTTYTLWRIDKQTQSLQFLAIGIRDFLDLMMNRWN